MQIPVHEPPPIVDEEKLNPAIVAKLYVDHGDELRRFLLGILRDPQLANDAVQGAFAKMLEQGHKSREETRKAWLFRVAYNEAMLVRRRAAVGDKVVRRVAWSADAESHDDDPLVRFESVAAVQAAIEELSPDQRQVVRMRIYEEKTFAVIAKELSIPLGTALGRMRTALIKLRSILETDSEK